MPRVKKEPFTHKTVPASFAAGSAILDVTTNRAKLAKRVKMGKGEKIPVVVVGVIDDQWGGDDGESIGFVLEVVGIHEIVDIEDPRDGEGEAVKTMLKAIRK